MSRALTFYIDGTWVDPVTPATLPVIDPSNEEAYAEIALCSAADVDTAVAAAKTMPIAAEDSQKQPPGKPARFTAGRSSADGVDEAQ